MKTILYNIYESTDANNVDMLATIENAISEKHAIEIYESQTNQYLKNDRQIKEYGKRAEFKAVKVKSGDNYVAWDAKKKKIIIATML